MSDKTVLIVACNPRDDLVIGIYLKVLEDAGIAVPGAGLIQVNYLPVPGGGANAEVLSSIEELMQEAEFIVMFAHSLCGAVEEAPLPRLLANAAQLAEGGYEVVTVWVDELTGTIAVIKPELISHTVAPEFLFSLN